MWPCPIGVVVDDVKDYSPSCLMKGHDHLTELKDPESMVRPAECMDGEASRVHLLALVPSEKALIDYR